jgi:hypothetical protein
VLTLADLTIRRFMAALFNGQRDGLDNWDELYTSYIDLSGMGKSREFSLLTQIHNLSTRLQTIGAFITLQQDFYIHFGCPLQRYIRDGIECDPFEDVRKFGYRIAWKPEAPEQFLSDLRKMDTKERRNVAELDKVEKELADLQAKGKPKEVDSRKDFTRMLTVLNREGYRFDKDTTYMDELCDMIADNNERVQVALEQQQNTKK